MPWTETELAYMAGIVDGEGSICIFPSYGKTKGNIYRRPRLVLSLANTDETLIRWVEAKFGGKAWKVSRARIQQKDCFQWQIGHLKAAEVIAAIKPYLIIKHKQAEIFLLCQATMKRRGSKGTPANVLNFREKAILEMRSLNRKGIS